MRNFICCCVGICCLCPSPAAGTGKSHWLSYSRPDLSFCSGSVLFWTAFINKCCHLFAWKPFDDLRAAHYAWTAHCFMPEDQPSACRLFCFPWLRSHCFPFCRWCGYSRGTFYFRYHQHVCRRLPALRYFLCDLYEKPRSGYSAAFCAPRCIFLHPSCTKTHACIPVK